MPSVSVEPLPDGQSYRLYTWRLALARASFEMVDLGLQSSVADALASRGASLAFNAGFFALDGSPEGLHVARGRTLAPWLGRIGGGALVVRGGHARLYDGEQPVERSGAADVALGVQCRPRLVVDGRPNVRRDDGRRADRTALCVRDGGRTLELDVARTDDVMGMGGPTLYALARTLHARGCQQALNLDGGPSTSVAWRGPTGSETLEARGPVRVAVVVKVAPGTR